MNNDLMIDGGLSKITAKLAELENNKPEAYTFKTNCRWKESNIKTLSKQALTLVVIDIVKEQHECELAKKVLIDNGLSCSDIDDIKGCLNDSLDDVLYMMKKLNWMEQKRNLETKKSKLESFYSEDKKNQMSVEALLADL